MNDQKSDKQPAVPSTTSAAPSTNGARDDMPKVKQITFAQQLGIWLLIIVVGALFGMSGSLGILQGGHGSRNGVDQREITIRQNVDHKLEKALGLRMAFQDEQYVELIKVSRVADDEGLMPSGKALDRLVEDFLSRKLTSGSTYKDALNEHKGGDNEVTRDELRRHLAELTAYRAYGTRHIVAPAIPIPVGVEASTLTQLSPYEPRQAGAERHDRVQVDEAEIEGSSMLPTVAEDDAEIEPTYAKLRGRFTRPQSATVTIAYADIAALRAKIQVSDEDVKSYYNAHAKDPEFLKPKAADAKPETPQESKTLDDAKALIVDRLTGERALEMAKAAAEGLDAYITENGVEDQKDNAAFKQAAQTAGMALKEQVVIEEPSKERNAMYEQITGRPMPRMLQLGDLGSMHDQIGLFAVNKEPGFVSRAVQTDGPPPTYIVLRVESRQDAGFKPLAEVKPQIISYLKGQRAYADFMKQAEAARAAAEKLGPGGLAAYLASPEGAMWKSKVTPTTLPPTQTLSTPPVQPGQPSMDQRIAASLVLPSRPVALVEADPDSGSDIPKAKLIQARGYEAGKPGDVATRAQEAQAYRNALREFSGKLFEPEIERIKNQK